MMKNPYVNIPAALAYLKDARIAITEPGIRRLANDGMKADIEKLVKDIQLLEDSLIQDEEANANTNYGTITPRRYF